jgi:hypothetical protein
VGPLNRTIADPSVRATLIARLRRITPETPRRWGTMSAAEMLCHLGDAHEGVTGVRQTPGPRSNGPGRPLVKWFALSTPFPWPRGVPTRPGVDPRVAGTRPAGFAADLDRAVASLEALAATDPARLASHHALFGPMKPSDWYRWAYRHVGHHLRQFGL